MDIAVFNPELDLIGILDVYESLIWTERYNKAGDFEFYAPFSEEYLSLLLPGNYLSIEESDQSMIAESIKIESDLENGSHIIASGRSIESILDRRIVWNQTRLRGNLQNAIKRLLNENVIFPNDQTSPRKIPNFTFVESTDPRIIAITISQIQFTGDNLLEAIASLCELYGVGFRIQIVGSELQFKLYYGTNRSYTNLDGTDQTDNAWIVFSPDNENLMTSEYNLSTDQLKTIALVAGDGEGDNRTHVEVPKTDQEGLERRELYVDARDVSRYDGTEVLDDDDYEELLVNRGLSKLLDYDYVEKFDADIGDPDYPIYRQDYYLGDIVQVENEYGLQTRARITDYTISDSSDGIKSYPTFGAL